MAPRKTASKAKTLGSTVHLNVGDERYVVFPAGTKVGDKVGDDEFTADLAEKITNPKAWEAPESDDSDADEADGE
jgi:hypothetical protein